MGNLDIIIISVIISALLFDFVNGWNDSANAIATVVSTRVLSPLQAITLAGVLNFIGAFASTKVAKTIGTKIIDPAGITLFVVLAAILAATVWIIFLTLIGLPISASHSLVGGLVGAGFAFDGFAVLKFDGILTVLLALFLSPIMGLLIGALLMTLIYWLFRQWSQSKVNKHFGKFQILSVSFMAFTHGTNDAQKAMGVITLALFSGGYIGSFDVPLWVIVACGLSIALGTAVGGWKVIKTVGSKLLKLQPVHGFAAETSASIVLSIAAGLGVPVSTTHTITSSIMGVGASRRLSAVRWGVGKKIIYAWFFTLPICAIMGWLMFKLVHVVFG